MRLKKLLLCVLCAALTVSAFALPLRLAPDGANADSDRDFHDFVHALTSIYHDYDTELDSRDLDNPYALNRLMVCDFNGDTYGAADYAYDSENDFAVLQYNSEAETEAALAAMLQDGLTAEPDTIAELDVDGKCNFDVNASTTLGLPTFFDHYDMAADDVIVAVLDTGVMYDHNAITDRFYSTGVDLSADQNDDAYYDTTEETKYYSHATFVSGIIANNTADSVKIQPYKLVAFGTTAASASAIVAGINAAVKDGASVINISMHTGGGSTAITKAVDNATNKGVCICASAGNNSKECEEIYPACSPNAITVSATDGTALASFSNYGEVIDFAAPGTNVISTWAGPDGNTFKRWSGTSFSTPYITAVCADVKSMNKDTTMPEVYDVLRDFAADYGEAGFDTSFGYGVPDLSDIHYTDGNTYSYRLPQGTLTVTACPDYTADTQPWRAFAEKMVSVTVDESVTDIGSYSFYNMLLATFTLPAGLKNIGDYAFYRCAQLPEYTFDIEVESVGYKAFGGIEDFSVSGYRNTAAEAYAVAEDIPFTVLGCKHNYIYEVFDPTATEEGYTLYTCTVCGDSYRGAYIEPIVLESGSCGEQLTYTVYDTGKLVISGTGAMYDYYEREAPWFCLRDQIQILELRSDVTAISPFAFYGCNKLAKIRCYSDNPYLYTDGTGLFDSSTDELLLVAAHGKYVIPENAAAVSAPAFIAAGNFALEPSSRFRVKDGILYDTAGNLICALPSYAAETLEPEANVTVKQYAFMYTQYPKILDTNLLRIVFEPYSIGYYYDGAMRKTALSFKAFAESTAYRYAEENGFEVDGADIGQCGDDITWRYDADAQSLTFTGSGDMYDYHSVDELPWSDYLPTLKTVVIGDAVHAVSDYAFCGAKTLTSLTMPLSLQAPQVPDTWDGCTALKTVNLTYGTGTMDDYTDEGNPDVYKYTPWYLSRSKITSFTLDPNVKYIGAEAFRNCLAIKSITLNSIEEIGAEAFINCSSLKSVTITNKSCVLPDYCLVSHNGVTYGPYPKAVIYAYDDSDAHDYALHIGAKFESLGCGHSRGWEVVSEIVEDSGMITVTTRCADCGTEEVFTTACNFMLLLQTTTGLPIADAAVRLDAYTLGVTDSDGCLCAYVPCGTEYVLAVSQYETEIFAASVCFEGDDIESTVTVRYADFVNDGVINAKDYAYALRHGGGDASLFDYGVVTAGDSRLQWQERAGE
ncbi:MAG: leucine-rich repeat protein [Eubacterium sp.]|nr:leucine-rich repeat protein [Eubacterium sp.]